MTDDVFQITTAHPDVATLAQGYINRADGERILLPLPTPCEEGAGVRFVVLLSDGTPAFAGAGRCLQHSDQGDTVPPEQRFETLIDSLQFDERSQPVYDYIVAVRNAAYAQGQEEAAAGEAETHEAQGAAQEFADADTDAVEVPAVEDADAPEDAAQEVVGRDYAQGSGYDSEPAYEVSDSEPYSIEEHEVLVDASAIAAEAEAEAAPQAPPVEEIAEPAGPEPADEVDLEPQVEAHAPVEELAPEADAYAAEPPVEVYEETPEQPEQPAWGAHEGVAQAQAQNEAQDELVALYEQPGEAMREPPVAELGELGELGGATAQGVPHEEAPYEIAYDAGLADPAPVSFQPPAIPTGILSRPVLAVHWSPAAPRRPTPRPASGHFQYARGNLPRPPTPPRPDLDPSFWVQRAPRPAEASSAS